MPLVCECGKKTKDGVIATCGAHVQKMIGTPDQLRTERKKDDSLYTRRERWLKRQGKPVRRRKQK